MQTARPTCFVCFKPKVTCICSSVKRVHNRTAITVLQHPREVGHPIGTARFVELGLQNAEVRIAYSAAQDLRVSYVPNEGTGVLYPSPHARDLQTLAPNERPKGLIVLDGTWPQAKSLYRRNSWLNALPHYALSPSSPSRYRIRREPRPDYVSTLESVVLALSALEPELQGLDALLRAFDQMIDTQITQAAAAEARGDAHRRFKQRAPRSFRGVPAWFADHFDELVGVYAEVAPRDCSHGGRRPLLHIAAVRIAEGSVFEQRVLPEHPSLLERLDLSYLGLSLEDFADALPARDALQELRTFVGDGTALAWTDISPFIAHEDVSLPSPKLLRNVARSLLGQARRRSETPPAGPYTLKRLAELWADGPFHSLPIRGRSGERLSYLYALAHGARRRARLPRFAEETK